jgi:hypothetical protein
MKKNNRQGVVKPFGLRPLALMELLLNLPPIAEQMLLALEIECLRHGGKNNGKIVHTYDDFERDGFRRKSVNRVIKLLVQSGIIKKKAGRPGVNGYERPNLFGITYWPTWSGKKWIPATNEWLKQRANGAGKQNSRSGQNAPTARSGQNAPTGHQKAGNGQNSRSVRKIRKPTVVKTPLLSRYMLTKPPTDSQVRERTPSSPQTQSAEGMSGANGGDAGQGKIPWTTPQLVEIQVTPEEWAELERSRNLPSGAFVATPKSCLFLKYPVKTDI